MKLTLEIELRTTDGSSPEEGLATDAVCRELLAHQISWMDTSLGRTIEAVLCHVNAEAHP